MSIHPTALVAKGAQIGQGVEIGPYTIVGPNVKIGAGTKIANHAVLDGFTEIGERCSIFSGACIGTPPQDKKAKGVQASLIIGNDNVIREYATINLGSTEGSKTVVGNRNYLMIGSHVAHDCVLGDDITIANSVGLSGHVTVEDKAVIGGLTGVHQFVRIGKLSMIGGVSRVVMDIAPFSICSGNPAKFYGLNIVGLKRSGYSVEDSSKIKQALKILFTKGLRLPEALERLENEFKGNKDVEHLARFVKGSERGIIRKDTEE